MTKARLLSTVAATLLFAAGAASAQDLKKDEAPAHAPAVQQKAPAEKIAPAIKPGDQKASVKPSETTGHAPKSSEMDNKSPAANKAADSKHPTDPNGNVELKGKTESSPAQRSDSGAGMKSTDSNKADSSAATGQGVASTVKLSTEQRSRITTIIKQQKVEPAKLNVSVRVGTRIPDSVRFYPLPAEVFVVYPEWRGYDYILVGDEILVIDPRTHQIVALLVA